MQIGCKNKNNYLILIIVRYKSNKHLGFETWLNLRAEKSRNGASEESECITTEP